MHSGTLLKHIVVAIHPVKRNLAFEFFSVQRQPFWVRVPEGSWSPGGSGGSPGGVWGLGPSWAFGGGGASWAVLRGVLSRLGQSGGASVPLPSPLGGRHPRPLPKPSSPPMTCAPHPTTTQHSIRIQSPTAWGGHGLGRQTGRRLRCTDAIPFRTS